MNKKIKHISMQKATLLSICLLVSAFLQAQSTSNHGNKFEQLTTILPPGNDIRGMDGAPGPAYWQQRVDYDIECKLDEKNLRLDGSEMMVVSFNE